MAMRLLILGVSGPAHCHLGTRVTLQPVEKANPNYINLFSYPTSAVKGCSDCRNFRPSAHLTKFPQLCCVLRVFPIKAVYRLHSKASQI